MSDPILVLVTTASTADARALARTLVQEGHVACANLVPVAASIYAWKGEICEDQETLMVMESTQDQFEAMRARIAELHDYEVPKIVGLPITTCMSPTSHGFASMSDEDQPEPPAAPRPRAHHGAPVCNKRPPSCTAKTAGSP